MGRKKRAGTSAEHPDHPFAALEGLREALPGGPPSEDEAAGAAPAAFAPKVVIRRERSGRGGKTVTVIDGVLLAGSERDALLRELRKSLGTSGRIEGETLVLGGDLDDRLEAALKRAGARRIVRGN